MEQIRSQDLDMKLGNQIPLKEPIKTLASTTQKLFPANVTRQQSPVLNENSNKEKGPNNTQDDNLNDIIEMGCCNVLFENNAKKSYEKSMDHAVHSNESSHDNVIDAVGNNIRGSSVLEICHEFNTALYYLYISKYKSVYR